ncbi:ECF transporter S component [Clostridium hydrogenum]|uniref:ECF transporter S component n=1 Tax=Clostridium hydrogenum TaxID=2855764 RepID=UPI001F223A55|nr:ECF transporter S component [Clostridium hydrogenum]
MKKLISSLILSLVIALMAAAFKYGSENTFPAIVTGIVFSIIILAYFYFEKSSMGTKEIALIGGISAFASASRVVFTGIPNVQPVTFIVAITGMVFGPFEGFLVGSTTAFISNIFLGQGPWTPWQMFSWGLVGYLSGIMGKKEKKMPVEIFAIICFLYGFMFDWIMDIWHVLGYIRPINVKTVFLAYLAGITFDVMHAVGNFIFCIVFYDKFYKILNRFKKKITYKKV